MEYLLLIFFFSFCIGYRWYNATLVGPTCLSDDIMNHLRQVLIDNDGKLSTRCKKILSESDFIPEDASLLPLGDCLGSLTPTYQPGVPNATLNEILEDDIDPSWADDYLLTFIVPGIIITLMLLLAAVIACVLYRRRRTGKLGLEERRGFVSKGIPIIFAEELEERPSGRHPAKAPVILKVMPYQVYYTNTHFEVFHSLAPLLSYPLLIKF